MKYLKKYNENQDQQDPEFAITKIKEEYSFDFFRTVDFDTEDEIFSIRNDSDSELK